MNAYNMEQQIKDLLHVSVQQSTYEV